MAVLATLATSCSTIDYPDVCASIQDCIGGNDKDAEACERTFELFEETADAQGCEDEFEAWVECYYGAATCEFVSYGYYCETSADCDAWTSNGGVCVTNTCEGKAYTVPDSLLCEREFNALNACDQLNFNILGGS